MRSPSLRRWLTGTGAPVNQETAGRAKVARKRERKGLGAGTPPFDDIRLRLMDRDGDTGLVDKLGEASVVVGVGVGNDDPAYTIEGEATAQEAAGNDTGTPWQSRVDENGVAGLGENCYPGPNCPQLVNAVGNSYGLAEQIRSPVMN